MKKLLSIKKVLFLSLTIIFCSCVDPEKEEALRNAERLKAEAFEYCESFPEDYLDIRPGYMKYVINDYGPDSLTNILVPQKNENNIYSLEIFPDSTYYLYYNSLFINSFDSTLVSTFEDTGKIYFEESNFYYSTLTGRYHRDYFQYFISDYDNKKSKTIYEYDELCSTTFFYYKKRLNEQDSIYLIFSH